MNFTVLMSIGGVLIVFVWTLIKWRIVRGAKQAGRDEQKIAQMEQAESDYQQINDMARLEDESLYWRINQDFDDGDLVAGPWVPDRSGKAKE